MNNWADSIHQDYTFYIYHIPGHKVGCTRNFINRIKHYAYGTNFIILEIIENITPRQAGDIEWRYADKFGYERGRHYSVVGYPLSEQGLNNMRRKLTGRTRSAKAIQQASATYKSRNYEAWNKGIEMSDEWKATQKEAMNRPETIEKIVAAQKRVRQTPEWKTKRSQALKGKPAWNKGITHSEETRNKISEKTKGRVPWNKGMSKAEQDKYRHDKQDSIN